MAETGGSQQFEREVFPVEIEEIRRRRGNTGDRRTLPNAEDGPSTQHDLMGLAFSGGGIRSASFSIGVVQHLITKGVFEKVDYLSTVSGGGYAGACLSALMSKARHGERLLVDREGAMEPPALNHVRNCSNYLLSDGLLNRLQIPALFIAGLFHSLLMLLPPIVLMVLLTELFFELTSYFLIDTRHWLAVIGVVPLLLALILRPLRSRGSWAERDRADRRLGGWLLLAVVSLLAVPAIKWLGDAVNYDAAWVFRNIARFFQEQRDLGLRSWLLWIGLATGAALVVGAVQLRMRLALLLVGILGPLFLLSIYVMLCIYTINSPGAKDENGALRQAINAYRAVATAPEGALRPATLTTQAGAVEAIVRDLLVTKHIDPDDYAIQWDVLRNTGALVLRRHKEAPLWMRLLTQQGSPELHIGFVSGWWSAFGRAEDAYPHIVIDELKLLKGNAEWWLYLGGLLLWLYNTFFMNLNAISMHPFYRDRLSRTFLVAPEGDPAAKTLAPADDLLLSKLGGAQSAAPYHLINTALNLQGSDNPQLRERKTVPFILAQRFCGSDLTGYCQTARLEAVDPNFNLGTAMAISAAAASPNMGTVSARPLTFLLALLNMRLNYWLPHPDMAGHRSWYLRLLYGRPGLLYLLSEALGSVNERKPFINCSDGGHIENLAVYELLRRRCRTIICVDGESDPNFAFFGFITMQRYAEIDLGARIDIQLDPLRPRDGISQRHHAVGTITYAGGEEGTFIYLKLSYSGDEPEYLRFYRHMSPVFPHETTADQFFDETQFEVYRALGYHVAKGVTEDPAAGLEAAPMPAGKPPATLVAM